MKKKLKTLVVTMLIVAIAVSCCGCITGRIYGKPLDEATALDVSQGVLYLEQITVYMQEHDLESIQKMGYHYGKAGAAEFDDFWQDYLDLEEEYGAITDRNLSESYSYADCPAFVGELITESGATLMLQMYFSASYELYRLYIYLSAEDAEAKVSMPEDVTEIDVVLNAGGEFELPGKITLPAGAMEEGKPLTAAVLVGGDGANTMDMDAGNTHMYRDLAWDLAQQGIVTLRFDKRTLVWSDVALDENADISVFTVDWEYIDDANAAAAMLAELPYVDAENIWYIGHSQGAQMAARADEEAGGLYAGFVLINTSPRNWAEVIYDQYINYGLCDRDYDQIYYLVSKIDTEKKFILEGSCAKMREDEMTTTFILSRAAGFWVDYMSYDYVQGLKDLAKPTLILQGEADYQITREVDFTAWEQELEGCAWASLQCFEGLNHLMTPSGGVFEGHYKEFDIPGCVPEAVGEAIASFMGQ